MCLLGIATYTKDINAIMPLQEGVTYLKMLCSMKTHYPVCLQKQSQTNIDVSPHLATFVESFSKLQAHDNYDSREVQADSPHINSDNAATPHVLIDE